MFSNFWSKWKINTTYQHVPNINQVLCLLFLLRHYFVNHAGVNTTDTYPIKKESQPLSLKPYSTKNYENADTQEEKSKKRKRGECPHNGTN